MIVDRNSDFDFTAYDSMHGIKINTKANNFINLIQIIVPSQSPLHGLGLYIVYNTCTIRAIINNIKSNQI